MDSVTKYLKINNVPLKERLKVQSHFYQKKKVFREKANILQLMSRGLQEKGLDNPQVRQDFLNEVDNLKSDFWKNFLSLHVAIYAKNLPWANKLKKKIVKSSPFTLLVEGLPFNEQEEEVVRDYLLKILEDYVEILKDEEGGKIIAKFLSDIVDTNNFRLLKTRLNADWSLTQIRDNMKNPLHQQEYFDFWFYILMNRSSDVEVKRRFRDFIDPDLVKSAGQGQFWVFEHFFPSDKEIREILRKRLLLMWRRGDLNDQYTVLRSILNANLKQYLAKENDNFKRADFQLQREFFQNVLNTGLSTPFALYHLSLLGNLDENDLWWLM
ncbi:MAG: hypothetical protein NXH75_00870, partial [Halobacteriovoraceae bacterium]|nr:hypothetical protein [Halobacteriovoraceae bacterium]